MMTNKERMDVVRELVDWFEGQEIPMIEAVPILSTVTMFCIASIAKVGGANAKDGLDALIAGQKEQLALMEKQLNEQERRNLSRRH